MIVCHCVRVGSRTVEATIAAGAETVSEVSQMCRAASRCGSCRTTIEAMLAACVDRADVRIAAVA